MILVVRPFLIVELIRHFLFTPLFNLRLVYLPSDVLHVHKKYNCVTEASPGSCEGLGSGNFQKRLAVALGGAEEKAR